MAGIETASARPRSPVSAEITARQHVLVQDKPPGLGGRDEGVMASEYLLAALLACQLSTFHKVNAKRHTGIEARRIEGNLHFDEAGDIHTVALLWELDVPDALPDEKVDTVLRLTDKACTISKVLNVPLARQFVRV